MNLRLKNLRENIIRLKLDGFVSFNPSDIFYLTGFRAENSFIFISRKNAVLVVPELAYPSAKNTADCDVRIAEENFFGKYKNKEIGFEDSISYKQFEKLKITKIGLKNCPGLVEDLRIVKNKSEISKIKTACKISKQAILFALKKIRAGMAEKKLAAELEYFLRQHGAEKSAFDIITASGENSADPHHKPTDRKFLKNDIVVVDLGCVYEGYSSDLTRTFFLGKIDKLAEKIFETVKDAQEKALVVVKNGAACKKIDFAARNLIDKNGFGKYFIHGTGHGVGIDVHEEPSLSAKSKTVLKSGMVVTVEPGIYIPGKFGVRIEDTVSVKENGCEVLTR